MSGSCIRKRKECMNESIKNVCKGSKKITGKKWERPISKSKEYWEKFCDAEEKRLIIVRDPFFRLSYHSVPENDSELLNLNSNVFDKAPNQNYFSNSCTDDRNASDNSLHKLFPIGSKLKLSKGRFDGTEFPKPILKSSCRTVSQIPNTICNLATSSKVVRIPKLDTLGPQPSFRKILPSKVDRTRASFSVQNEPKAQGESSSILPTLGTAPTTSDSQLTVKKLRKHLRLPDKKDFKIKDQSRYKIDTAKDKKPSTNQTTIPQIKGESQKALTNEDFLKYSARIAYKALKRLTKNKNLDFKLKTNERFQEEPFPKSRDDSSPTDDEKENLPNIKRIDEHQQSEEHSYICDLQKISEQKSLEDSESMRTDVECATFRSDETASKTIPTETRYTSGPSPEFVYLEDWEGPSSRILSSIPKLSGFPRKNRDRCLPCMYKSFETPPERKISLPKTVLQRIIDAERCKVISPKDSFEDNDSDSMSSFENEVERILNFEFETRDVRFDEEFNAPESEVITEVGSCFREKCEQQAEAVEAKSIPESEASLKAVTKKAKEDQQDDDRNLNEGTISIARVTSLERGKVSSSFHSDSSSEHDSIVVSISDDQLKPKYLVPCHAPTNFKPSLEPLRALRNRKPTTLQDRIAFLESSSLKKSTSIDDCDDVPEKPKSMPKEVLEKDKIGNEGKPVPPPLTKAKSVVEKLMLEKAETSAEKKRQVLRKGISFTGFSLSQDIAFDKSEIHSDASKDALRELDATRDDGFLKTPFATDFSSAETKLPLTRPNEVMEILENLEENVSSTGMLEMLCKEFSERLSNSTENDDSNTKQRNKMITNLTKLLIDSKRYLHPDKYPSDLVFSTNQPPRCNSRLLKQLLPVDTFNLIAPLLGMSKSQTRKESDLTLHDLNDTISQIQVVDNMSRNDSLIVHPPSSRYSESIGVKVKAGRRRYNPYGLFLTKPRRKVVTWRPLTKRDLEGYDPDATLEMRADNLMKRICQDFCQWVETLGGTDNTIDEEVLRDMFEIDFSAEVCRAIQVSIQEMPVVPAEVALTRNCPRASKLAMTMKHVMQDVKAEQRPAKVKAFGTSIPWKLRFVPPNNQVRKKWLQCENVPKDIETMDVVWKDITHLRSVRGFVEWLQQHPEVRQPQVLKNIASMNIEMLRQIEEDETFAHLELDIDQIKSLKVVVNGDAA